MFTPDDRKWLSWLIVIVLIVIGTITGVNFPIPPPPLDAGEEITTQGLEGGITDLTGLRVIVPTIFTTATPGAVVNNQGLGNAFEIQDAGTPVFYVDASGNTTITGTCSGCSINSGSGLRIVQPTAGATATPALAINSLAAGAKLLEILDASTPVFSILNGGAVVQVGGRTATGGDTINNWVIVSAPTAIATATPAMVVDSLGVANILEVRDAATPVFTVNDGGAVVQVGARTASGGDTVNNWSIVSAPTAIATATPAMVVDSLGLSAILEIRDAATPIAQFQDGGILDLIANPIEQDVDTENLGVLPSVVSTAITYTAAAGGTGAVATIADGEIWFVHGVFVNVTTDFDCTGDDTTLVVGDGADPNGFVDLADAELQVADTEQTGSPAGWQGLVAATMGVYLDGAVSSAPHIYAPSGAAETIDYLIDEASGETITAGAATIYVVYTRIQ